MNNEQYHEFLKQVKNHKPVMQGKEAFVDKVMQETNVKSVNHYGKRSVLFRWTAYPAVRYTLTGAAAACLILFAIQNAILFSRVQKVEHQITIQQQNPLSLHQVNTSKVESYMEKYSAFVNLSEKEDFDIDKLLEHNEELLKQNKEIRRFLKNHPEVKKMMEEETSIYDGVPKVSL